MSRSRTTKTSVTLGDVTHGDLVQVQGLTMESVPCAQILHLFRIGEVVQCLSAEADGVLVARGDGSRRLIPMDCARSVRVLWYARYPVEDAHDETRVHRRPTRPGRSDQWRKRSRA